MTQMIIMKSLFKCNAKEFAYIKNMEKRIKDYNLEKEILDKLPWSQENWYVDVFNWVSKAFESNDLGTIVDIDDNRFWELSHTIMFKTDKNSEYVFKASDTSGVFANEANISELMLQIVPAYLPRVVASDKAKGWVLTEKIGCCNDEDNFKNYDANNCQLYDIVSNFHIDSMNHMQKAKDFKVPVKDLNWVLEITKKTIENHKALNLKNNTVSDMIDSLPKFEDRIKKINSFEISNTLIHGDLHECNVMWHNDRFYLFDWADICISFPLLELRDLYYKKNYGAPDATSSLNAYFNPWKSLMDIHAVHECWKEIQPIIPLFYSGVHFQILESANFVPGSFEDVIDCLLNEAVSVERGISYV